MVVTVKQNGSAAPAWYKTGSAATTGLQAEKARIEAAKEAAGKVRRFYLKEGEEKQITFLDGNLLADGSLDFFAFHEHTIQTMGKWQTFTCTKDVEPCPICNSGEKPSYCGAFTIINHTPYTIQNGPNAGKVVQNQRELYVAKFTTLQLLQHLAAKRHGLAGWTVEVSRMSDKDPRVGGAFQFMERTELAVLAAKYGEDAKIADYPNEIAFLPAADILKMGIGKALTGPGYEKVGSTLLSDKELIDSM